jgi:cell division protein FtsI (penicillin-binding protein 3)
MPTIDPINGSDIYLTIDIELQKIVEFELMQGVKNADATSGTVIAIKPESGEILACASYPTYNPNIPSTYTSDNMRIRAVTDAYEPGSTFKAITASAALSEDAVKPTDLFNGFNGSFVQTNYTIKDEHPLGLATFADAFKYSSNIILSQVALKIPEHSFYKYIRDFGFGLKTGIDLPGEVSGKTPKGILRSVDKRFLGYGYGIMVTPVQLTTAYSAIANDGKLMKPYVMQKIVNADKSETKQKPQSIRNVITESTAETMTTLLTSVVQNGTGTKAFIPDLKIAGKTGTAQLLISGKYSTSNHIASFIGYYPADNPQICMLVLIDKPKSNYYGGSVAAPIFKSIALRWASISPNILDAKTSNTNVIEMVGNRPNTSLVYVPELKGSSIDDAENILTSIGLIAKYGSREGIVMSQYPEAGKRIKVGSTISLNVANKTSDTPLPSPNVVGLSLRQAIAVLHNAGYKAQVKGSGIVQEQYWEKNAKNEKVCVLICK